MEICVCAGGVRRVGRNGRISLLGFRYAAGFWDGAARVPRRVSVGWCISVDTHCSTSSGFAMLTHLPLCRGRLVPYPLFQLRAQRGHTEGLYHTQCYPLRRGRLVPYPMYPLHRGRSYAFGMAAGLSPAGWIARSAPSPLENTRFPRVFHSFHVFSIHSAAACLAAATASSSQRLLKAFSAWPLTQ